MSTDIVTITHDAGGMRIMWPEGSGRTFANISYLADAYVRAVRSAFHTRKALRQLQERCGDLGRVLERDTRSAHRGSGHAARRLTFVLFVPFVVQSFTDN
jgi:hypothetical protein